MRHLRYYAAAEDELARIYAGEFTAQQGAGNIVAAWEPIPDQIGRASQISHYRASLGLG
jgi:multiple sugar transport system substrate-binding protein